MDKTYIELFQTENKKGYYGRKNGNFYYLFPPQDSNRVAYRMLIFDNEEDFEKRLTGERVNAKQVVGIKEMTGDNGNRFSGMLFNRDEKKARYVNLYDNIAPSPEKNYDKMIILKQAEYRELPVQSSIQDIEIGD